MTAVVLLAAVLALPAAPRAAGAPLDQDALAPAAGPASTSPYYLERAPGRREPGPLDDVPTVVDDLAAVLRDGRVPGFYDGQFAATADRFDELVRVARDPIFHPTVRIMAVMALQEAADGEPLRQALQPLLLDPDVEYDIEYEEASWIWQGRAPGPLDDDLVRRQQQADLSRHARFALAKDGQPEAVLERIAVMRSYVERQRRQILDPGLSPRNAFSVWHGRQVWFDIAYHYQQFDDFEQASHWFRQLCDALPPGPDTRMAHYNLACMAALTGRPDEAMAELAAAVQAGFLDVAWMDEDGDLASLRGRDDYQALRAQMLGPAEPPVPGEPDVGGEPVRAGEREEQPEAPPEGGD